MSAPHPPSPLLTLPLELRTQIYERLIPGLIPVPDGVSPQRFGASIFLLNRQIHFEASQQLFSRTCTITVHEHGIDFLGTRLSFHDPMPLSFPYDKVRAVRILIRTPREKPCIVHSVGMWPDRFSSRSTWPWKMFERNLRTVDVMLRKVAAEKKGEHAFCKIILDAAGADQLYHGPEAPQAGREGLVMYTDISRLFDTLGLEEEIARECEIRVNSWARTCSKTMWLVGSWGRVMSREGGEAVVVFMEPDA